MRGHKGAHPPHKCRTAVACKYAVEESELSKILGISKNKAYEVVNRYDFPKIRVGRRIIISKKHFLEWMDANFSKERNNT